MGVGVRAGLGAKPRQSVRSASAVYRFIPRHVPPTPVLKLFKFLLRVYLEVAKVEANRKEYKKLSEIEIEVDDICKSVTHDICITEICSDKCERNE